MIRRYLPFLPLVSVVFFTAAVPRTASAQAAVAREIVCTAASAEPCWAEGTCLTHRNLYDAALGSRLMAGTECAAAWLRYAAERGSGWAASELAGYLSSTENGTLPFDWVEAVRWARAAVGSDRVWFSVGGSGLYPRNAVEIAEVAAIRRFGLYRAAQVLARAYRDGSAVDPDPAEALGWFRYAADMLKSDATASGMFRALFPHGSQGSYAMAVWPVADLDAAAAEILYAGDGVEPDAGAFFAHASDAAAWGSPLGYYLVGMAYGSAYGAPLDVPESYGWLRLAYAWGHEDAAGPISQLQEYMAPAQRAAAEVRAEQLREQFSVPLQ